MDARLSTSKGTRARAIIRDGPLITPAKTMKCLVSG